MVSTNVATPDPASAPSSSATTVASVQKISELELESLRASSFIEVITERVTAAAGTTGFIVAHVLWFSVWMTVNLLSPWVFDPFPFSFLTLVVSLEAILLTVFILRAQGKMALVSDRRAHLDLQVNLLAERELTAILRVVYAHAKHDGVAVEGSEPHLDEMLAETDVRELADEIARGLESSGSCSEPLS